MKIRIEASEIKNISFYSFTNADCAYLSFTDEKQNRIQIELTAEMVKYLQDQIELDHSIREFMKDLKETN